VNTPIAQDRIWNGADDNGSGSVGLLGLARTFALGPRPRRSVVFIWHAGEEADLIGSRYMVSFPVVALDRVQAMFNIDMIGRNRDDKASEANTVYVIGADRISTDLHNSLVATNTSLSRPMTLNFEFNDPADAESFYTRSDHYSYAAKGIPVAFFFSGTHDDYHANSDTADRIIDPKLVRVADLIYRVGYAVANAPQPLERDRLGARAGRDFSGGPLPKPAR
jgi:Zn-dependent M28 family amino/carboxypeptidase